MPTSLPVSRSRTIRWSQKGVEGIDIEAGTVGSGEAFPEFQVKDVVAKALAFDQIFRGLRKGDTEERSFG